jgi:hypothetical protein
MKTVPSSGDVANQSEFVAARNFVQISGVARFLESAAETAQNDTFIREILSETYQHFRICRPTSHCRDSKVAWALTMALTIHWNGRGRQSTTTIAL